MSMHPCLMIGYLQSQWTTISGYLISIRACVAHSFGLRYLNNGLFWGHTSGLFNLNTGLLWGIVAHTLGLLDLNSGLLRGIVARIFGLLDLNNGLLWCPEGPSTQTPWYKVPVTTLDMVFGYLKPLRKTTASVGPRAAWHMRRLTSGDPLAMVGPLALTISPIIIWHGGYMWLTAPQHPRFLARLLRTHPLKSRAPKSMPHARQAHGTRHGRCALSRVIRSSSID